MDYSKLIVEKKLDDNIKKILLDPFKNIPTIEMALELSKKYSLALHPAYLFYWNEISPSEFISFLNEIKKINYIFENNEFIFQFPSKNLKRNFEVLGIEHSILKKKIEEIKSEDEAYVIELDNLNSKMFLLNLGLELKFEKEKYLKRLEYLELISKNNLSKKLNEILSIESLEIRDKGGTYIGARMGRPEKAKMRKQFNDEVNSHGLFPVGEGVNKTTQDLKTGEEKIENFQNRSKNLINLFDVGNVEENFRIYHCEKCQKEIIYPKCPECNSLGIQKFFEKRSGIELRTENENSVWYKKIKIDLNSIEKDLRKILGSNIEYPKHVKGISETINKHHTTEHISKAFLRALNNVYVNKDGTIRYDMIEMGLTHFKAKEIGTSIEKLKELGYILDYLGNPLENDNQLLEIFPQDVILPDCSASGDELASDYVINTCNYVDDLLEKLYKLPKFYNCKTKEDTIGHLIIGLAPHTSAGIVGRIIGYSKTQGCFSHPVWHAAQRRNLDGDENGIMLLLEGLINFSREYLPDRRGSRTMDVSLVLTSHLYLDQIDDEVHGMDIVPYYPLEFYRAAKEFKSPKEIKIEKLDWRLAELDFDKRYLGYFFTHNNEDLNNTILCSSYKSVPSMIEKMDLQLNLARKIRAVDEHKVGSYIIDKHFMKDIKGNLRKFGMQTFRCTNCNTKYRRPPLNGKCSHCGKNSINFTIHEGSIKKYLEPSFKIIREFNIDPYIVESLELANLRIEGVFGKELEQQKSLKNFFSK